MTRLVEAFIGNPFALVTDSVVDTLLGEPHAPSPATVPIPHPRALPEDVDGFASLPSWAAYAVACAAIDAYGWEGPWKARCAAWGWIVPLHVRPTSCAPSVALTRAGVVWTRPGR